MPRFFTKRNNGKYVNAVTKQAEPSKPKEGWYITYHPSTGREFYVNLSGKYGSMYKSQLKAADPSTYNELMKILPTTNHPSLYSRERMEEFDRYNPKAEATVAPVKILTSANLAGKLEAAERAREALEDELAELKRQMASGVPPASAVSNDPAVAKFKKMLSMGIPRTAVDQKMRMEGLDPSMLNGPSALGQPSAPFRPTGNPMAGLMSGILGGPGGLKKTNGPQKAVVMNAPKDPKKQAAMGIAEAAAAKRAEMAARGNTRSIEERLANLKKAKVPAPINPLKAAITGFNKGSLANPATRRGSNTNLRLNTPDPSSPKTRKNRRANFRT